MNIYEYMILFTLLKEVELTMNISRVVLGWANVTHLGEGLGGRGGGDGRGGLGIRGGEGGLCSGMEN